MPLTLALILVQHLTLLYIYDIIILHPYRCNIVWCKKMSSIDEEQKAFCCKIIDKIRINPNILDNKNDYFYFSCLKKNITDSVTLLCEAESFLEKGNYFSSLDICSYLLLYSLEHNIKVQKQILNLLYSILICVNEYLLAYELSEAIYIAELKTNGGKNTKFYRYFNALAALSDGLYDDKKMFQLYNYTIFFAKNPKYAFLKSESETKNDLLRIRQKVRKEYKI